MTLSGTVDTFAKKWAANRAVKRFFGVREVAEEIKVNFPGSFQISDEEIAKSAA